MTISYNNIFTRLIENAANVSISETQPTSTQIEGPLEVSIHETYCSLKYGAIKKDVNFSEFLKLLLRDTENLISQESEILLLPFGTYAFSKTLNKIKLSCYYPGQKREIKFLSHSGKILTYEVPFPNTIITFDLEKISEGISKWQVNSAQYFITSHPVTRLPENKIITKSDRSLGIKEMPFSNFYRGGSMCYGSNQMPVRFTDNLRGLDYYYQIIFASTFNSDLGIKGMKQSFTPAQFYTYLSKLDSFPYEEME